MLFSVPIKIAYKTEFLQTYFTFEWLLSSMSSHVDFKITLVHKSFAQNSHEWFLLFSMFNSSIFSLKKKINQI